MSLLFIYSSTAHRSHLKFKMTRAAQVTSLSDSAGFSGSQEFGRVCASTKHTQGFFQKLSDSAVSFWIPTANNWNLLHQSNFSEMNFATVKNHLKR